jgi:tetratricopeptide (TPR) repeat protein
MLDTHASSPSAAENYYELITQGDIAFSEERYSDAIEYYQQAVQFRRANPRIWYNLGQSYEALGKYDLASECFRRM